MTVNESNYEEWVRHAENDWKTIEAVSIIPGGLLEVAAFHAQQCAEKYLEGIPY
jgi:HEPN domain-containing protein